MKFKPTPELAELLTDFIGLLNTIAILVVAYLSGATNPWGFVLMLALILIEMRFDAEEVSR